MSVDLPVVDATPSTWTASEPVWDRLWRHRPSNARDDALLARERCSPRWSLIVDRLESTFGSIRGLNTIELGCGRGDLSVLLAQGGARVTLLDRSEAALQEAERRFERLGLSARFEYGDIVGALDSRQGRFDVAVSLGVIEHFKGSDRTEALRGHHEVLTPGGMAVISVPHSWCLPYRLWKLHLELRRRWPYGMEVPYSKRELLGRAKKAGLSLAEVHGLGFRRSIGDHWCSGSPKRRWDRVDKPSRLDSMMGLVLLMFAWRDGSWQRQVSVS